MFKKTIIIFLLSFISNTFAMKRVHEDDETQAANTTKRIKIRDKSLEATQAKEILLKIASNKDYFIEDNFIEKYPYISEYINEPLDNNQNSALHLAIKNCVDIGIIKFFIQELKADVNKVNKFGSTPLHLAAHYKPESIELLLNKGANIEAKDNHGATPLLIAAQFKPELIELLLNKGANIEAKSNNGFTPLHIAAISKPESIEILLNKGANIEAKDNNGSTPLHMAAQYKPEAIEILLNKGANIEAKNNYGSTPLHLAAKFKPEFIEKLISKGANIDAKNNNDVTPLHIAAQFKPESIEILLGQGANMEAKDNREFTPLHVATQFNPKSIEILLNKGANIEAKDKTGLTPLHMAAAIKPEFIELLLNKGANIEAKNNYGSTPLHLAAKFNHKSVELLINKGANIEAKNNYGSTPLHIAIGQKQNKSVKILLKNKANLKATLTNQTKNAIQIALNSNNGIIYNLIEAEADIEDIKTSGNYNYQVKLLELFALHKFLNFENIKILQKNVESVGFLSLGEKLRHTLLKIINNYKTEITKELIVVAVSPIINNEIKSIIKHGINLNIIDLNNNRLIDYAAKTGNKDLFLFLLICGAELDHITIEHFIANNHFELLVDLISKFNNS